MADRNRQNTKLRTPATWTRYQNRRSTLKPDQCFLCELHHLKVITEFKHWVIVQNQYPYDAVADEHHLLAPKVHVPDTDDLDVDDLTEYQDVVIPYLEDRYDFIGQNTPHNQTQPQHVHLHLLTWARV